MDDTERWLYWHDPHYEDASDGWRHVKTGTYKIPAQEVPGGMGGNIDLLVATGVACEIVPPEQRVCQGCDELFTPSGQQPRFCSELCRKREENRRAYRRRRAA